MKTIKIQYKDIWSRTDGKEPMNNSPILDYCRKLISDGEDPKTRLEVYRIVIQEELEVEVLCLVIKEIEEGAKWAILENNKKRNAGPKFIKYKPFPEMLKE